MTKNDPVNRRDPSGLDYNDGPHFAPGPIITLPSVSVTVRGSFDPVSGGSLIGGLLGNDAMALLEGAPEGIEPPQQPTILPKTGGPIDTHQILDEARQQWRAWDEYTNCLRTNPTAIAANKQLRKDTAPDFPWGPVRSGSSVAIRYIWAGTVTVTSVGGFLISLVWASNNESVRLNKAFEQYSKAISPVVADCKKKVESKYGFTPRFPTHPDWNV